VVSIAEVGTIKIRVHHRFPRQLQAALVIVRFLRVSALTVLLIVPILSVSHAASRDVDLVRTSASPAVQQRLQARYAALAADLAQRCPMSNPGDQQAFDRCRQALFGASVLRSSLSPIILWGRARGSALTETPLTQFAPDVYAGLYAPLFMFAGTAMVTFDQDEQLYKAVLPVGFRNRLPPGQFPYPFWHDKTKWSSYQATVALQFFIDPDSDLIKVAQFVPGAPSPTVLAEATEAAASFDGHWLWTDGNGRTQPQVTLFDGLYRADNPHVAEIESRYRALALEMREAECDSCHVPGNPQKLKRLVLLQTPAHAAGEIRRILESVRNGDMPQDDTGIEKPLPPAVKQRLLARAEAFEAILTAARDWENRHAAE